MLRIKQLIPLLLLITVGNSSMAQPAKQRIATLLATQTQAWNRGDIPGFMSGYWQHDSLVFVGKRGVTYGWQQTLDQYLKNYPDAAAMGNLTFDILNIQKLDNHHYTVLGKWFLKRSKGDVGGHFTLILKRFKKGWKIISDHSS